MTDREFWLVLLLYAAGCVVGLVLYYTAPTAAPPSPPPSTGEIDL